MKTYWNEKRQKVDLWKDEAGGKKYFWERVDGISNPISERVYNNRIKKFDLQ